MSAGTSLCSRINKTGGTGYISNSNCYMAIEDRVVSKVKKGNMRSIGDSTGLGYIEAWVVFS